LLFYALFQDHESVIRAIYTGSQFLESVGHGSEVGIVLESTSFYAEQGGQVLHVVGYLQPICVKVEGLWNLSLIILPVGT
jgi:alanyl-tRNA synthetase